VTEQSSPPGRVLVVGSANLDLVATTARHPTPGETLIGHDYSEHPGGKGLNQAVAAARAGSPTRFVGAVGRDDAGQTLTRVAGEADVDTSEVAVVDVSTGRALIIVADSGENSIVVVPGANELCPAGAARAGEVVLAQLEVPLNTVESTFRRAREVGATTVLNPAPARPLPPELLDLVDIIVPNEHELDLLGGVSNLLEKGVGTVVVTLGAEGARVHTSEGAVDIPTLSVDAVDTTGAGDTFCGYLASGLASGLPLESAARRGCLAAALSTTRPGAVPSIPTSAEVGGLSTS
jgi:ribokinase